MDYQIQSPVMGGRGSAKATKRLRVALASAIHHGAFCLGIKMADHYTKLFNSIIHSTIWREDDKTRILWVTMLAMSDENGNVLSSLPGLADAARITIKECETSLEKLMQPDPYSRTQDYEGRRIAVIDDGWHILNREKYKNKGKDRTEYWKEYKRRKRAENKDLSTGGHVESVDIPQNSTQEKEKEKEEEVKKKNTKKKKAEDNFLLFWKKYPKKVGKQAALRKFQTLNPNAELLEQILTAIDQQKASSQWTSEGGKFIPHPATWLNQGRWEDEVDSEITKRNQAEADRRYREKQKRYGIL